MSLGLYRASPWPCPSPFKAYQGLLVTRFNSHSSAGLSTPINPINHPLALTPRSSPSPGQGAGGFSHFLSLCVLSSGSGVCCLPRGLTQPPMSFTALRISLQCNTAVRFPCAGFLSFPSSMRAGNMPGLPLRDSQTPWGQAPSIAHPGKTPVGGCC